MSKKQWIYLAGTILTVFVLGLGIRWFWSLGETTVAAYPSVAIQPTSGKVEWRRQGETDWKTVQANTNLLPGDEIRTGADGEAKLVWGDQGETRLQANSSMRIDAAPSAGQASTGRIIRMRLETGRAWSRFMKLLDLNSKIETQMGDVVATVRGTAFGVSNLNGPEVAVTDSVVSVGTGTGQPTLLREGRLGHFSTTGTPLVVRDLNASDTWPNQQAVQDAAAWQAWKTSVEQDLQRLQAGQPRGPASLQSLSRQFHLSFTGGAKREQLEAAYLDAELAKRWLSGQGLSDLTINPPLSVEAHEQFIWEIQRYLKLAELDPTHQNWIAPLSAWRDQLFAYNPAAAFFIKIVALDEKVDAAILPGTLVDALKNNPDQIRALRKDLSDLELSLERMSDIDAVGKIPLRIRMEAVGERLDINLLPVAPTDIPTTPTSTLISTSTEPVLVVPPPVRGIVPPVRAPQPAPTQPLAQPIYSKVGLFATPGSTNIGGRVNLRMMAYRADGTSDDVTSRTTFSIGQAADGGITGNIFIPAQAGMPTVSGSFLDNGFPQFAFTQITVAKAATSKSFSSLELVVPITSTVCNTNVSYTVIAHYTDGTTQNVTIFAGISVSDPSVLLLLTDGVVTKCNTADVSATLQASYTEAGVTRTASQVIKVIYDQAGNISPGPNRGFVK